MTTRDLVRKIQQHEQRQLRLAMMLAHAGSGCKVSFGVDKPVIAGYLHDKPTDITITAVKITDDSKLIIYGYDAEVISEPQEIDPYDIFAGQLEYITDMI